MTPPPEFCEAPNKPFDVAIVGGGIAGVTMALHLVLHRIPVTLYEQSPKFGEIGAGVSWGPNAARALALISPHLTKAFEDAKTSNLSEDKKDVWFEFRYGETCDGKHPDGGLICTLKCEGGQRGVRRSAFLDNMIKLLPDGVAKFSKRLEILTQDDKVTLHFRDGTTAQHDVVLGCDGVKSVIRSAVLGAQDPAAKPTFSGKIAYRGLIPMPQAAELLGADLAGNSQMYLGRHGHILTFPINQGEIMNVVAFSSADSWGSSQWVKTATKDEIIKTYSHWGKSVRSIMDLIQEPDVWAIFDHPSARTYHKGHVCIMGDAAHATTPHKGGGAGMAVEDAYIMGNLLASAAEKKDVPVALAAFNKTRRERTQRLVIDSREQGRLFDLEEGTDDPQKLASNILHRMLWLWDHDLPKELDEAKALVEAGMQSALRVL